MNSPFRNGSWGQRLPAPPPVAVDSALALLAAVVAVLSVLQSEYIRTWWVYALALGTALPLPWRRRAPFVCLLLMTPCSEGISLWAHSAYPQVPVAAIVLIYTVAEQGADWQRWFTLVAATVITVLSTHSPNGAIFSWLPMAGGYILGSTVRELRRSIRAQAERAAQLEREAAVRAARATVEERARIAREMHDILAHAVSLMVVQAEAGPVAVRTRPDRAIAAFDAIADSGRDAMAQLRRMLGVLKEDGGAPERSPAPTLASLPAVLDRVRASGIRCELHTSGLDAPEPPQDVAAAAYRIVQEALTNTVRHASASRVDVRVERTESALEITVSDDGRGVPVPSSRQGGLWSGGRGLIGIRERAAACGGSATAGPGRDGRGFVVTARLPTDSGRT
ncbi:sensor histidine kinase [Streptomyces alanosinicus]|uniref:histidine kinase n=1 Tax=Streptomyces alanosinicus TaxID=68171 RepID=A0A919D2I1_9ACTN|nr:sensor histidine kinase [Streptomyces alanosinicus]GHE03640.1 two-component sensor histidine kinase [Streptomyces alanosinicus]